MKHSLLILTLIQIAFGIEIDSGSIENAKYKIAIPKNHNGKLLIYAHGLRQKEAPIIATLDINRKQNKEILQKNWIIATTSYRRNGWIIDDAMTDIDSLYKFITNKYGPINSTWVI